jgi:hypothetical protein
MRGAISLAGKLLVVCAQSNYGRVLYSNAVPSNSEPDYKCARLANIKCYSVCDMVTKVLHDGITHWIELPLTTSKLRQLRLPP